MGFSGDLNSFSLADIFQNLSMHKMGGTLKVHDEFSEKIIYFADGKISLVSTGKRKRASLGQLLVGFNRITEAQLAFALDKQRASSPRRLLGEILVSEGLCTDEDISGLLAFQVEEEIYDLFVWKNARFEFTEGEPAPDVAEQAKKNAIPVNVNNLVMEAARRIDEWERIKEFIPSTKDVILFNEEYAPAEGEKIEPSAEEQRVLDLTNGHRNVDEIVEASLMSRFDVSAILARYVTKGILRCRTAQEIVELAREELNNTRYEQVAKFLFRAVELLPDEINLRLGLANALLETGQKKEAVSMFEKMAPVLIETGESDRAIDIYNTLIKQNAEEPKYHYALIDIYTAKENTEEVTKEYKILLEHYLLNENLDMAIDVSKKLLTLHPEEISYRKKLSQIYLDKGDTANCVIELEKIADNMFNTKRRQASKELYQRILHLDPTHEASKGKLAQILHDEGRAERIKRKIVMASSIAAVILVLGLGYFIYHYLAGSALEAAGQNKAELQSVIDSYPFTSAASAAKEKIDEINKKEQKQKAAEKTLAENRNAAQAEAAKGNYEQAEKILSDAFDQYIAVYKSTGAKPKNDKEEDTDLSLWQVIIEEKKNFKSDFNDELSKCKAKAKSETANYNRFAQCAETLQQFLDTRWTMLHENPDFLEQDPPFNYELPFGALKKAVEEQIVAYKEAQEQYDYEVNEGFIRSAVDKIDDSINEARRVKIPMDDNDPVAPMLTDLYRDSILPNVMLSIQEYNTSVAMLKRLQESLRLAVQEKRWEDAFRNCHTIREKFMKTTIAKETEWPLIISASPIMAVVTINGEPLQRQGDSDLIVWFYQYDKEKKFEIEAKLRGHTAEKIVVEAGKQWNVQIKLNRNWKWKFAANAGAIETPLQLVDLKVDAKPEKALLFGSRNGNVYFISPGDGKEFQSITASKIKAKADVVGMPQYDSDRDIIYIPTYDNNVYAYKLSTGEKLFEIPTNELLKTDLRLQTIKIINDHKFLFIPGSDGKLYSYDTATSKLRWKYDAGIPIVSRPLADDHMVYIGGKKGLLGIDLDKGSKMNSWLDTEVVEAAPVMLADRSNTIIVGTNDGNLYAISPKKDKILWKYPTRNSISAPVTQKGDFLYFGNHGGTVYKLDTDGKEIWSSTLDKTAKISSPIVLGNGEIYVATRRGIIYALDESSGKILWSFDLQARVNSTPLFYNGILYIGCDDGNIYAFEV